MCGLVGAQPGMMTLYGAMRKALESRCNIVDVLEGGSPKVQVSPISPDELKRIADSLDE